MHDALPTFESAVHNVLAFSFGNDQYTRFTNQKIATYTGRSAGTAEILFQDLKSWFASFPKKTMSSTVTRLAHETQLGASIGFELPHFQF